MNIAVRAPVILRDGCPRRNILLLSRKGYAGPSLIIKGILSRLDYLLEDILFEF